jgi:hypothetical protein
MISETPSPVPWWNRALRVLASLVLLLLVGNAAEAQRGGGGQRPQGPGTGNPDEHLVAWKFVEKGATTEARPVSLYWFPASAEEAERSPLRTSRTFQEFERRCVGLFIVLPEIFALVEKLGAAGKLPSAVIVNTQGTVVRRLENVRGVLPVAAMEKLVNDELAARDEEMYHAMSEARKRIAANDKDGAIALFRGIWETRCLYPLAGIEAQRGLKELGVFVQEPPSTLQADPNLQILPQKPAKPPASGNEHHHH